MAKLTESKRAEWEAIVEKLMASQRFRPGIGRVLIVRDPRKEKLGELIHQAVQYSEQEQVGVVVALGHKRENAMGSKVDFCYHVGERVVINQLAGKSFNFIAGLEMSIVDEKEILVSWDG